ncbi:short-chain dehydrogenase/reductase SDR [Clostridium pasteurianum DSM 525 = ATCC 6013]|uniref:Short-chain dehydrogenase/reductase SDR n=1 Tax=Clostridium pasteurianum DSM 525 = ATCC 6013 TaxID=1262449 RepID=A0A0H3JAN5_CLOPA|nr:SDR family NAD(P)-dependent oxidoreductase [Clostridium pasteurianum]AJA48720.1 short-chain dehydrogenase/reductase SDR [Clostridium pasteurianum DSM 525 = ATCC 6013]AJA52708.1 short-chain dehydrogenase/reductase SDR [Clostridium pasteurianum DSM 525 = ATCC 6013]AOZ75944.1 short-chain dehydrogenase [Clostridium pasteurianum DSM 525 = ATCC 6013]AOZ79740.1 short-chain dehydrogenase [Clostridium pasteurianum]ELP60019.1 short-chain dehydrogenase/reductase SDR [Clostridium pasteurianum DSM 525 =
MNINSKNIIITGASSGIGARLLKKLLNYDVKIIAVARNIDMIPNNDKVIPFSCDISRQEEIDKLFEYAVNVFNHIDIFIANAGFAYCEEIAEANWQHTEEIYKTNVFSPIYSTEKMKEINVNKPYHMVITCSAVSTFPLPGYSLYCSTKAAMHMFAKTYRYEMRNRGRLTLVYPVATRTNFFTRAGGNDAPIPWPVQSVNIVADIIILGIKLNLKSIYPSVLFIIGSIINRIVPILFPICSKIFSINFYRWLKKNNMKPH